MNIKIEEMIQCHSIRRYQNKQIEECALEQILLAGLYAPSAGNNQYSRIVVCQDKEINEKMGKLNRYMQFKGNDPKKISHSISSEQPSIQDDFTIMNGFYDAPTVVTIFTRDSKYASEDAAVIASNLRLAAHFLHIGSCYIGRANDVFATDYGMDVRKEWNVPDDMVAICSVLLGYTQGDTPNAKPRKEGRIIRV